MIAANRPDRRNRKLLTVNPAGRMRHLTRVELGMLFNPGDAVIANDAATLPASLQGIHADSGDPLEVRLAAWSAIGDFTRFVAIALGPGNFRTPTEQRPPPPLLSPGDRLVLGPLTATVEQLRGHARLFALQFSGERSAVLAGLAKHGRPIQYAHVAAPLALWDVWTIVAAVPNAFEPPSAGFALDWHTLAAWRRRDVKFATLTHSAGISSTGDPALDRLLPFDEPYFVPERTAAIVNRAKADGGRIIAIGTTVVRALESAVSADGPLAAGIGTARGRIGRNTRLRLVDAILTGLHRPGESHYELLRSFADAFVLERAAATAFERGYQSHEFGDYMLIERQFSVT
jgi:S-adenosylmethionine:tRNA ribosyltransferase-isomerase